MAKEILIQLRTEDKASKNLKKVNTEVEKLGDKSKKSLGSTAKNVEDVQVALNRLGNKFRFMTIAFGALAAGSTTLVKSFLTSAMEMEAATLRVGVFAVSSGQNLEKANESALNLARTGLVSVTEASNALSNLLATGLNLDTANKLLKQMLDTAVLSKENLTDTFGKALEKSTLGIRILQERQVDAIGINFRADQVWRAYGKTIGKTSAEMSTQEKQMAIVNYLMKETSRFSGGAELAMNTFGGAVSRLNTNFEIMKAKIGATLIPLFGSLSNLFSNVSRSISNMAEQHAVLTSSMIMGVTIVITSIAALSALGAIIPLVTSGIKGLSSGMSLLAATTAATIIQYLAIAAAIGGVIFLVLKLTGAWDKWTNSVKNLSNRIKETIKRFEDQGDAASDAAEKTAKQIAKLEEQISLTSRTFKESMASWVKEHDEATKDIGKQIEDLSRDYKKSIDKINNDFKSSTEDMSLSHTRKVEDITRELEEEISKGIWADQTRIRDLKLRLKRENEDYALQSDEINAKKDEDIKEEKERYSERLEKLKNELDEEVQMYQKHAELINEARTWPLLDEIELMKRTQDERIADLQEQIAETKNSTDAQSTMMSNLNDIINKVSGNSDELSKKLNDIAQVKGQQCVVTYNKVSDAINSAKNNADSFRQKIEDMLTPASSISTIFDNVKSYVSDIWTNIRNISNSKQPAIQTPTTGYSTGFGNLYNGTTFNSLVDPFRNLLHYAEGGIIPGSSNQAVPIMAHGGETVLPADYAPITININNPTVRQDSDIQAIANAVQSILSRNQYLRHFK